MAARLPAIMIVAAAASPTVTIFSFRGANDQRSPTAPTLASGPLISNNLAIATAMTNHRAGTNQMSSGAPDARHFRAPQLSGGRGPGEGDRRLSSKDPILPLECTPEGWPSGLGQAAAGLPAAAVHDLVERSPVQPPERTKRPVSRVAEG